MRRQAQQNLTLNVIDCRRLSPEEKIVKCAEIYEVYRQVFTNRSKDYFYEYLFGKKPTANNHAEEAAHTERIVMAKIAQYSNAQGQIVGFVVFQIQEREFNGELCGIASSAAGFLHGYKNNGRAFQFGISEAGKYKLRHPCRKMFFIENLLGPKAYSMIVNNVDEFYPKPGYDNPSLLPPYVRCALTDSQSILHVNLVGGDNNPFLVKGDTGIDSAIYGQTMLEKEADNKVDEYFQEHVIPGSNNSLLVIIPLTIHNLAVSFFKNRKRRHGYSPAESPNVQMSKSSSAAAATPDTPSAGNCTSP